MPTRPTLPPLLTEPAPPVIDMQSASAQGATDLAETALWRYHLRYWHEHRAQDEVIVTVSFNNVPGSHDNVAQEGAPRGVEYELTVQLVFSADGESIEALRLTRATDRALPADRWPHVGYRTSDGATVDLDTSTGDGHVRTYVLDPPAPSWPSQGVGLTWDGLDVAGLQNARASLVAVRNRGLGGHDADTQTTVYRTATVHARDVVVPCNRWPHDVDISDLGDTVDAALDAAFATLFINVPIGQRVAMRFSYGYALPSGTGPDDAPMAYVPVGLYYIQPITAQTAAQIGALLSDWKASTEPPAQGAVWVISLAQFSQIDTGTTQPLLELDRLVYRLR